MIRAELDSTLRARIRSVTPLAGVRAGSALVFTAGRLLVVQDDALSVAWLDVTSGAIEHVALEGNGEAMTKAKKPDFESAFLEPDGSILILGSGSTPARYRAARLDVTNRTVSFVDCTALFEAITAQLGSTPNIEGAVRSGDGLRLFHRGAGSKASGVGDAKNADDVSAVIEVAAASVGASTVVVHALTRCDLGRAAGVALTFTDATTWGETVLYLAVAEDTPNAVDDGPIAGAAVGILSANTARFALLEDPDGTPTHRKVEGIAIDPITRALYLVTDPDDPLRPAELCRVELEGYPE